MSRESSAARRVGLLVLAGLALSVATLMVLGDRQNLFARKNRYTVRFERVSGLAVGSTVQLNGVQVGHVRKIVLPSDQEIELLEVQITVDARYAARIRGDSQARIKTLGLLGDKYLELTSGSPDAPEIPPDGIIPAAPTTDVDRLAATGQDVVDNVAIIADQLAGVLGKIERGEGLLGRLLVDEETGERVSGQIDQTLDAVRRTAQGLDDRRGAVGRLLHDREMAERIAVSVERLESVLSKLDSGEGSLPALLSDPSTKERLDSILARLDEASENLAGVTGDLGRKDSEALLAKLLRDDEFGREVASELRGLLSELRQIAEKINRGDGSVARLLYDPSVAEAVDDILVGIDESRLLRWLVRNRQKKGIEVRYEDELDAQRAVGVEPEPLD